MKKEAWSTPEIGLSVLRYSRSLGGYRLRRKGKVKEIGFKKRG